MISGHEIMTMTDVDKLASEVDAIDRIGHTSGWDTLAGIVTVLRAITSEV